MTKKLIIAVFVLATAVVLTSCGKKGDLVRPAAVAPDVHISVPIAFIQQ